MRDACGVEVRSAPPVALLSVRRFRADPSDTHGGSAARNRNLWHAYCSSRAPSPPGGPPSRQKTAFLRKPELRLEPRLTIDEYLAGSGRLVHGAPSHRSAQAAPLKERKECCGRPTATINPADG